MKLTKILSLILVVIMFGSLVACSGAKEDANPDVLEIGDYVAAYKGYEIVKDDYDKDTIVITFDYTNNSQETDSFLWSIYYTVKQNGTELESGTIIDDETFESVFDSEMAEVEPGQTAEVQIAYNLADLSSDVVIEASDLMDEYKDTLTIKIAE